MRDGPSFPRVLKHICEKEIGRLRCRPFLFLASRTVRSEPPNRHGTTETLDGGLTFDTVLVLLFATQMLRPS